MAIFLIKCAISTMLQNPNSYPNDQVGKGRMKKYLMGHCRYWSGFANSWLDVDSRQTRSDKIDPVVLEKRFRVNTDSFNGGSKFLTPSQFKLFTDSSRNTSGKTGCGVALYKRTTIIDPHVV